MNKPIVTQCPYYSYSDFKRTLCPNDLEFVVVPRNEDDQCRDVHGGTLCTNCANHKTFTYLALMCIDNKHCKSWHPYILLMLTISYNYVLY